MATPYRRALDHLATLTNPRQHAKMLYPLPKILLLNLSAMIAGVGHLRSSGASTGDPEIITIDGKTSPRSHDRRKGRNPLHLISAWHASRSRWGKG